MQASKNRFGKPCLCTTLDMLMYPFMTEVLIKDPHNVKAMRKAQENDFSRFAENMRR